MNSKELLKIANEFGTPVYVYDAESIKVQYEKLTSSFLKHTKFFYAAKALTNINILKLSRTWVLLWIVYLLMK
jgi:diaminopimelate decarboxylase